MNGDYQAKCENIAAYLKISGGQLRTFKWFKIEQVPRTENVEANSLARLASRLENGALGQAPIETLVEPSTKEYANHIMTIDPSPSWIDPIFEFLEEGNTLKDKNKARMIRYQANRYTILNRKLYKRGYAKPHLRCL